MIGFKSKNELKKIVENAIKFSYPDKPIDVSSVEDDSTYTLKVKNYGRGMSEDEIKNITPFLQHNRQIHEQQGNGLGLMIVKRLTQPAASRLNWMSKTSGCRLGFEATSWALNI